MILRVCVVIPCFDNPRTISSVLKEVVNKTSFPILVIDDGSETPVANVLYSFEVKGALEEGRLRVVRFERNRGKGAALRYAIKDLVAKGFTHMVTMDGDGRQLGSEIAKLTDLSARHPWDLIIGNRNLKSDPPGLFQRLGRKIMNFCVRFETGSSLKDTRSGFRLYPLFSLQMLRFKTRRYDWELEALIRLLWDGVKVQEVDVETALFDPEEHVIHFHRFWDSLRLWMLNTALLAVSMVRTRATPRELGLSMGLGVFIGCTPVFGFHTLILLALALVFPLNFLAMFVGSHIALPPLVPFLMMTEVHIGQHWLKIPAAHGLMGHFTQWAAGSLVLGVLLGIPAALLTYWAVREAQNPDAAVDLAVAQARRHRLLKFVVKRLGLRPAYAALPLISLWRYLVLMRARRGLSEYYRVMQPGQGWWRRQLAIYRHLRKCAEIQIDGLALSTGRHPGVITKSDGVLGTSHRSGLSPVVMTAHLGSWETASSALRPAPQRLYGDRSTGCNYELILFMGRLAPFDVTPFQKAVEQEVPLTFSFGVKVAPRMYELYSRLPADYQLKPGTPERLQILEWTGRFVRQLEFYVRRYPDQWFNLYPFWSSLPPRPETHGGVFIEDLTWPATSAPAGRLDKNP